MQIKINTDDETRKIAITGNATADEVESLLRSHGYDPDAVEWSVQKSLQQRVKELE